MVSQSSLESRNGVGQGPAHSRLRHCNFRVLLRAFVFPPNDGSEVRKKRDGSILVPMNMQDSSLLKASSRGRPLARYPKPDNRRRTLPALKGPSQPVWFNARGTIEFRAEVLGIVKTRRVLQRSVRSRRFPILCQQIPAVSCPSTIVSDATIAPDIFATALSSKNPIWLSAIGHKCRRVSREAFRMTGIQTSTCKRWNKSISRSLQRRQRTLRGNQLRAGEERSNAQPST